MCWKFSNTLLHVFLMILPKKTFLLVTVHFCGVLYKEKYTVEVIQSSF